MRILFAVILILTHVSLYSQNFAVFAGPNRTIFYDYISPGGNSGHYQSNYTPEFGYTVGINTRPWKVFSLPILFSLQFDHYSGKIEASDGAIASGYTVSAAVEKSVLSLGIYLLNFRVKNRLDLNFGVDFSGLVQEQYEGIYYTWTLPGPTSQTTDLQNEYDKFSETMYAGFRARIAYDVPLGKSVVLSPQFNYRLGLTPEFRAFPTKTKSMQFYLCLGIKKKLS